MPDYAALQITVTTILSFCAAVCALWSMYKVWTELKRPVTDRIKRLEALETKVASDSERIMSVEDATRLTLKAQLALIDSQTGHGDVQVKEVKKEIHDYLLKSAVR